MDTIRTKQHLQPKTYHFYAWFFPGLFTTRRDEKLFLEYTKSQKQLAIPRLITTGLLLQIFCAFVPGEVDFVFAYALTLTAFIANLTLLALHYAVRSKRTIVSHVTWFVIWAQLLISALRRQGDAYNELLGWAALLQYLTLAALPFSTPILIIYSILSFSAYLITQYCNASIMENNLPEDFLYQEICNGSVLLCASLLGATGFVIYENRYRRSFVETKRSLRDKLTIEQQSKEQERLLLSVLPEHVAIQMRKDLGLIDTQFKKIYMSRHENVSILYADIVGFTAISSTYSAQDLVAILNELFARFDRLAEKYQQLRIKILGDCYYCISGAPVERTDHAVLCVHMGLSMVKAIKYVQQTTNSPVDMRVGIHTGAVLAGVLGQRQWQFDVYSRDVELANKMESSGMAGRVHVSEVTLGFLKDEFEVEPAYGEKREEMLRQAGIKTYFIVKVLKPYHGDEKSGEGAEEEGDDTLSDIRDDDEESVLSNEGEKQGSEDMLIHDMLEEELKNRDDDKELEGTGCCLGFYSKAEKAYMRRGDSNPSLLLLPPMYMALLYIVVTVLAVPFKTIEQTCLNYLTTTSANIFIFFMIQRWAIAKDKAQNPQIRMVFSIIHFTVFMYFNVIQVIYCAYVEGNLQEAMLNNATQANATVELVFAHPSYHYHMASCLFCCGVLITPASWLCRLLFFMLIGVNYLLPTILMPRSDARLPFDQDPYMRLQNGTFPYMDNYIFNLQVIHYFRHIIMIHLMIWCICIFDRYMEEQEWARHLRGMRMRQQAEQAGDLRRRNQALVYNVLPPHVARHFMGAHRNHRDLYSQSYAEVGVLFASMPNFTEFYSEETVNNQGLECLRFLNEVISDFDTLLGNIRFSKDIIKIKTISSTYMAASGLNPDRELKNTETTTLRWNHLMCLVEFALELQKVLAAINEQSFNHFVLRMGVNHGPITAGVIGAKKPHYDIWGNTVNVASRMESTGKAGCIQVTDETCNILKDFGYYFEQRGLVSVKGKGQLMTYYLQGRNSDKPKEGSQEPTPGADVDGSCDRPLLMENGSAKVFESKLDTQQDEVVVNIPLLEIKK